MSKSTKSYEERLLEMERREQESLEKANVILEMSGLKPNEYRFIKRYSCEEGEMLGLDTY